MRKIFVLFFVLALAACNTPKDPPVFKGVGNIRVNQVKGSTALVNADAYFNNPNNVKMKLKKVDVEVFLDDKRVGVINESLKTKIPANADFTIPLDATLDLKETGLLQNILSMLGGKKRDVTYKGYIKVSMYGWPVKVPVDYSSEVRINL